MGYSVILTGDARRQLKKLDPRVARRIVDYLAEVSRLDDPRQRGKSLVGDRAGIWRYRVGDYRVLCEIQDAQLVILVLETGHRSTIYGD